MNNFFVTWANFKGVSNLRKETINPNHYCEISVGNHSYCLYFFLSKRVFIRRHTAAEYIAIVEFTIPIENDKIIWEKNSNQVPDNVHEEVINYCDDTLKSLTKFKTFL